MDLPNARSQDQGEQIGDDYSVDETLGVGVLVAAAVVFGSAGVPAGATDPAGGRGFATPNYMWQFPIPEKEKNVKYGEKKAQKYSKAFKKPSKL